MKKTLLTLASVLFGCTLAFAQSPEITSWLQNTTQNGTYYVSGNSTPLDNGIPYNCQEVSYSSNYVYIKTHGIPAYPTGPFLDGNPSVASDQNAIFQIPRNPQANTGTLTPTTMGNIGVFINGAALFDNRDGVQWDSTSNALCGGPGNPPCPGGPTATMAWSRDAVPAERPGFDCSKGHPAQGNYHHHQNPSAFKLDLNVVSNICNLYDADGLYAIDSTQHSPLIGYAYDGFPIYGAYGYKNSDGTGGIARMKSSYKLATYSVRTNYPNGVDVPDGPPVDATYFLGYFREDYQYISHTEEDYLDEHNGRFCVTPEYPGGTYAYFATVDENWNSAYPYAVGPTFYGVWADRKVASITESVTVYDPSTASLTEEEFNQKDIRIIPNPASDLIAVQIGGLTEQDMLIQLMDLTGKVVMESTIKAGQTISYFDVTTLYSGTYLVRTSVGDHSTTSKVIIK